MSFDNNPQPPNPFERLSTAHARVTELTPESYREDVESCYMAYRIALFDTLTADYAPDRFDMAWKMITFADPVVDELLGLPEGSDMYSKAVERVKELVKSSYENAPWD